MKGKRILCAILATILLVPVEASASMGESAVAESLYIQTLSCPEDIMDYAAANAARFVMSMDETSSLDYDTIHLGQPFTYGDSVRNLFTFPVFSGDIVVYTFRVAYAPDNTIHGTMSTFLVDELNTYMGKTTKDIPLLFDVIDNALYVCIENEAKKICDVPESESPVNDVDAETCALTLMETKNISEFLDVDFFWGSTRDPYKYIALDLKEKQFPNGDQWCTAYVTAAIIRTCAGAQARAGFSGIMAKDIMEWVFGDGVSLNQGLDFDDAAVYAREVGRLTATTYTSTALSNSRLMSEINSNRPVALAMTNRANGTAHAIALRGYTLSNSKWSIWDPTNQDLAYETFTIDGDYISSFGNVFFYDGRTIYNFYAYW